MDRQRQRCYEHRRFGIRLELQNITLIAVMEQVCPAGTEQQIAERGPEKCAREDDVAVIALVAVGVVHF